MNRRVPDRPDAVEWAATWAQRWFLDEFGDDRLALPDGTSGGWAFHVESFEALVRLAREQRDGVSPQSMHPVAVLKRQGYDRQARSWGLRLLNATSRTSSDQGPIAVIGEIPTPSMLEPLVAVARELGSRVAVGAADPRVYRRFAAERLRPRALVIPLGAQREALREGRRALRPLLTSLRRDPPAMPLDGVDIGHEAIETLLPIASRSIPWAGVERSALREFLTASGARSVLLASDQHRIGRITSQVAREMGVRSIVAQHGLPRIPVGLLPVVANRVAAWSDESAAWFTTHGTDPGRVIVTGNPRLDAARSGGRAPSQQLVGDQLGISGSPNLLLALSPDGRDANPSLVATALAALERLPEARLVVKLHPGQGEWSWVAGQVRSSLAADRVRIARAEALPPLLRWADLTLLHRSTIALESLAYGTPIAVIGVAGTTSGADAELRNLAPPVARTDGDIVAIAEDVTSDAGRRRYLGERSEALERAVGPLDGRSSSRIASLLLEEAAASPRT